MKKYRIECFYKSSIYGDIIEIYECSVYSYGKFNGFNAIRLENVNTLKITSTGKEQRKQLSRGKYIPTEVCSHKKDIKILIIENDTGKIIEQFTAREES